MSHIKNKDTKPEILVRKFLFAKGFRYRLYGKDLPGKPDIILPKHKTVIFVNGCFWHGHKNCRYATIPATNTEFWQSKIEANISRDEKSIRELQNKGWRVVTIWQCDLRGGKQAGTLENLVKILRNEE